MNFDIEKLLFDKGYKNICGVDEAGRGPLAGRVYAAAVILPPFVMIDGLNDSKKLTEKKRNYLFNIILEKSLAYSISFAEVSEIEELNILNASQLAMRRAVENLQISADYALIDGNIDRDFQIPAQAVVKGDALSMSIAAASVLAKVTRDRMCEKMDEEYPQYGIAKHKGYGTKEHMAALRQHGPSPIHRTKFIRFLDDNKQDS